MKKGLVVILALFLVGTIGVFVDGQTEVAAAGKTITVGVNSENPPWIFAKDGKMTGFEADLVEEFAKRAGYTIEYKSAPFSTVLTGVQSGQWDIAMSSIWIKPERAAVMDFADPYYDSGIGMMTRKDGITDLSQMKGKAFGSDTGSANEAWLNDAQAEYGPYKIKSYDYWVDAALDLEAGRIDGVVVDDPIALYYIKQHPNSGLVMKIYIPGFKAGQALAFKKGSPLRDEFNKIQNEMKKTAPFLRFIKNGSVPRLPRIVPLSTLLHPTIPMKNQQCSKR
jgi:ABC-type amino acid transport substrate-binding protein